MAADASKVTLRNFFDWKDNCKVRQIQKQYEVIAEKAKENHRSVAKEMQQQGHKDFVAFNRQCPKFPLMCWPTELAELGSGAVLYFNFLTLLGTIFLICFLLQVPCMNIYAGENWMMGWQWSNWEASLFSSIDPCACIGDNNGVTGLAGLPTQDEYGKSCNAWDAPWQLGVDCATGSNCQLRNPGKWMCRKWCFAAEHCPTRLRSDAPSLSNIHFEGLVRSYSACSGEDTEASLAIDCTGPLSADVYFNESGSDFGSETFAIGSHWMTPGNFGPFQSTEALVPTLYFVCVCVMCGLILIGYQHMIMTDHKVDADTTSPNDYALMIRGLPQTATDEQAIMKWFSENALKASDSIEIVKVVIGWDVEEFRENIKQLQVLRKNMLKLEQGDPERKTIQKEMMEIQAKLNSAAPDRASKLRSSGIVVVTFRHQMDMRACLQRYTTFWARWFYCDAEDWCCFPGFCKAAPLPMFPVGDTPACKIQVERAANPGDINWMELGVDPGTRRLRMVKTNLAMLYIIACTFLATWGLNKLQKLTEVAASDKTDQNESYGFQALALLPALAVALMNMVLQMTARRLGAWEYHETKTEEEFSQAMKMSLGMIINTAGVIFFLNSQPKEWYMRGGLIDNAGSMLLVNSIFPPLMPLFQFNYILRCRTRRKLTQNKLDHFNEVIQRVGPNPSEPEQKKELNQVKADIEFFKKEGFAPDERDDPRRYADALKTAFCCVFFSPVLPFVSLLGFVGIALQYWVDKYALLRLFKRPEKPANCSMAMFSLRFFKRVAPVSLALAIYIFLTPSWQDRDVIWSTFILSIIVSATFAFALPVSVWAKCFLGCCTEEAIRDMDYYQAQYMWSKEMKYHKDQFIYAKLPDKVNPEYLSPDRSAAVAVADVKASYGVAAAQAAAAATTGSVGASQAAFRGGRVLGSSDSVGSAAAAPAQQPAQQPAPTTYGAAAAGYTPGLTPDEAEADSAFLVGVPAGSTYAPGVPAGGTYVPGMPASSSPASADVAPAFDAVAPASAAVWEFEVHDHWKAFASDCQQYIEKKYNDFSLRAGSARIRVNTSGVKLSIDFAQMTQMKTDTKRVSKIRRTTPG